MIIGYVDNEQAFSEIAKRYDVDFDRADFDKYLLRAFDKIECLDIRDSGKVNKFPRITEEEVPENIKKAQIHEAYAIALEGHSDYRVDHVKSKSTGNLSVTYSDSKLCGVRFLSAIAYDIMSKYTRKCYGWR